MMDDDILHTLATLEPDSCDHLDGDISSQSISGETPLTVQLMYARELDHQGKYKDALLAYSDLANIASRDSVSVVELKAFLRAAQLHQVLKEHNKAVTLYHHVLDLARELKDLHIICECYLQLGHSYLRLARQKQHKEATHPGKDDAVAELLSNATSNFEGLLTIAKTVSDAGNIAQARKGLGLVHLRQGKYEEALAQFKLYAHRANSPDGSPQLQENACHLQALTLTHMYESDTLGASLGATKAVFDEIVDLRWQQAAHASEMNDQLAVMGAYLELARLFESAGSYKDYRGVSKAKDLLNKVIVIGKGLDLKELGPRGATMLQKAQNSLDKLENAAQCAIS